MPPKKSELTRYLVQLLLHFASEVVVHILLEVALQERSEDEAYRSGSQGASLFVDVASGLRSSVHQKITNASLWMWPYVFVDVATRLRSKCGLKNTKEMTRWKWNVRFKNPGTVFVTFLYLGFRHDSLSVRRNRRKIA